MYQVIVTKTAEKQLDKIPNNYYILITTKLKKLVFDPRPSGCKKLVGYEHIYRIRVGSYRVIYTIDDNILIVEVIKVGTRQSVYD